MSSDDERLMLLLSCDLDRHFELLVLAYQHKLYAFALSLAGNRKEDAEEILQDAFLNAYHALKRYPPQQAQTLKPGPWLSKIVLNLSHNYHRKCRNCGPRPVSFDIPEGKELVERSEEHAGLSPEAEVEARESKEELYTQLAKLPECYHDVVCLHFIYGMQCAEIAEILNRPVNTVKSQARRGIQMLERAMAGEQAQKRGKVKL